MTAEEGAATRRVAPGWGAVVTALALGAAAFHLFAAGVSPFTALIQRPIHLAFMGTMAFLGVGVRWRRRRPRRWERVGSGMLGAALAAGCGYLVIEQGQLVLRSGSPTGADLLFGAVTLILVLELARRTTGWGLVAVALAALAYGMAGPWLPGLLAHRGYGARRLIEHLYLGTEGIWGVPLGVSADFVYLFVLFGTVLEAAGGGTLLIGLAGVVAGRSRGGPAKTAAVASAIMGSLSGSAVANVVTTGSLTIPVMKRSGFSPHVAGAIEAAASTGGQLMPPIMGAGAFILATWTNIPYARVALAAAVPAALYYLALIVAIDVRAGKLGLGAGAGAPAPDRAGVRGRLHLLFSLAVIVALLGLGRSPMRAAFWGVTSALLVTVLRPLTRLNAGALLGALRQGAAGTVQVAAACAAAGVVVGVASLTGIGLRMSQVIVTVSGGHLPVALGFTALGSIVLGMGLPTTAAYVVLAALGAPALTELGVPLLGAHLFIFYFGCLSNVTPPVSLAAYAGAGIAGAPPFRTATTAMALAAAGFMVPFMFIYDPALLLVGSVSDIVRAVLTGGAGVAGLVAAAVGFGIGPFRTAARALVAIGALLLLGAAAWSDAAGAALLGWGWWLHLRAARSLTG